MTQMRDGISSDPGEPELFPADPGVVVGVDGSESSRAAALWAARQADIRGYPLRLIHAYTIPVPLTPLEVMAPPVPELGQQVQSAAETMVSGVKDSVLAAFPRLKVESTVVRWAADKALLEASSGAALTVVGSTGHGVFAGTVLGSVALCLSAHIRGPLVVVRGGPAATGSKPGPVLVCVDGSIDPDGLLPFALEQASLAGSALVAVHCWQDEWPDGVWRPGADGILRTQSDKELSYLESRMAERSDLFPGVPRVLQVLSGRAATAVLKYVTALPEVDKPALIVVGSRGLGGVSGMLLGSTSHTLMTHAPCPVALVPVLPADPQTVGR